ncbi:MAG: ABC transporter permease subunit [Clostridia bacterium]|nr:ABC transporter permease subunit [Clostridia bacterium]
MSRNNELVLLILPSPKTVFLKWLDIAFTGPYIKAVLFSVLRIIVGFSLGVIIGFALGVFTHSVSVADTVLSPLIKVIRAVPVVAISILLFLFFSNDVLPIWIVCLMVTPLIWQSVHDSLSSPDVSLMEMARMFHLTKPQVFFNIKLPMMIPSLMSTAVSSLGLAWKSGLAAEVICLPDISLGTKLWQSKGNVEFDEVYAVTLTVVILSLIIEMLFKALYRRLLLKNGGSSDD